MVWYILVSINRGRAVGELVNQYGWCWAMSPVVSPEDWVNGRLQNWVNGRLQKERSSWALMVWYVCFSLGYSDGYVGGHVVDVCAGHLDQLIAPLWMSGSATRTSGVTLRQGVVTWKRSELPRCPTPSMHVRGWCVAAHSRIDVTLRMRDTTFRMSSLTKLVLVHDPFYPRTRWWMIARLLKWFADLDN